MSGKDISNERQALGKVLYDFLGPASKEMGKLISEQVRLYRWKQSLKILEKAEKIRKEIGVKPSPMPFNFLIPFIEKSSQSEEDDNLNTFWANILVDASKKTEVKHRVFTDILASLDRKEALLLKDLFRKTASYREKKIVGSKDSQANLVNSIRKDLGLFTEKSYRQKGNEREFRDHFEMCRVFIEESKIPVILTSLGYSTTNVHSSHSGTERPFGDEYMVNNMFDIFHMCRLDLLNEERISFDDVNVYGHKMNMSFHLILLSPLGYSFVETCEGARTKKRKSEVRKRSK